MEQLRNVYVDLSNVEISNTLEPTFFDVARDRRSREIIMDALDTNPLWPPLKKPFGNNSSVWHDKHKCRNFLDRLKQKSTTRINIYSSIAYFTFTR